jgi:hypothetical protein
MFPTDRFLVFYLYVLHAGLYEYDIQQWKATKDIESKHFYLYW